MKNSDILTIIIPLINAHSCANLLTSLSQQTNSSFALIIIGNTTEIDKTLLIHYRDCKILPSSASTMSALLAEGLGYSYTAYSTSLLPIFYIASTFVAKTLEAIASSKNNFDTLMPDHAVIENDCSMKYIIKNEHLEYRDLITNFSLFPSLISKTRNWQSFLQHFSHTNYYI
ncbi:MAG: hypothetical protein IT292_09955 [Deltaproteobacteria bacterium]|nr:hypothetical protein [Deltaproteobacteria bacterium]